MTKDSIVEFRGTVTEVLPGNMFKVMLDNEEEI
jgi:translation initiation factor IF-1